MVLKTLKIMTLIKLQLQLWVTIFFYGGLHAQSHDTIVDHNLKP